MIVTMLYGERAAKLLVTSQVILSPQLAAVIPLILFTSSRKSRWASRHPGLDEDARVDDGGDHRDPNVKYLSDFSGLDSVAHPSIS